MGAWHTWPVTALSTYKLFCMHAHIFLTTKIQTRTGVRASTKKYLRAMELKKRFVTREWFSGKIGKN